MEPEGESRTTVFVSYAHDDQVRARSVINALEGAGLKVWWDGLLEGGDTFLPTIETALEDAEAVVVLWSKTSIQSDWVRDEATIGRERGRLVPLSIDGTKPPLGFRQLQTIDLAKWNGKPSGPEIERMVRAISAFTGKAPSQAGLAPARPAVSRRALLAGGAAVVAGGAGLAAWKFWPGGASPDNSVAVLPFRNLSGDAEQDYFAEGISEQIRLTLSRNAKLLVLAPTSTATAAKDGPGDPKSLAERLGVSFVLSGIVRRAGDMLRISATLTDRKTGFPSWTDEFDKRLEDVFAVQESIATAIANVIAAQTSNDGEDTDRGQGGTRSVKAYDAFLRGNAFYALRSGEGAYRSALAQYDAAIAEDPRFAVAHAARARVIVVITNAFAKSSEFAAAYDDALASARRAVELAPNLASAHSTLGYVLVQGKLDLRGAVQPYETARRLGQGDAGVLSLYSAFAAEMGRGADAEAAITRAATLDPLNPGVHRMAGFVAYCARNWERSIDLNRKALSLNPQIDQSHAYIGDALCQLGRFAEAREMYAAEPRSLVSQTGLAIAAHRMGDAAAAKAASDRLVAEYGDASAYQQGQILAQAGQPDQAMAKLTLAREIGDVGLAMAKTDPMLDPLRSRSDFSALLNQLGFG